MIIGRAEYIDELLKMLKTTLDRALPLKDDETVMINRSKIVINEMLNHIQAGMGQGKQKKGGVLC